MTSGFFPKLSNSYRDFGARGAALYSLQWCLKKLPIGINVVKYHLVAQPVPEETNPPRPHALKIVQIERQNYNYDWFPRPREFIDARFDQHAICFVAFSEQTAVACLWLKHGPYLEDTVRALFKPMPEQQSVWDFDVYVQPDFRISRIFLHLWSHAFSWMREHDIRWTMSRIDAFNKGSIQAHQKLGAKIVDQIIFWRIGSFQISRSVTSPKWIWSRVGIPEYTVMAPTE